MTLYYRSNKHQVKYLLEYKLVENNVCSNRTGSKLDLIQIFFISLTENDFIIVTSTKTFVWDDSNIRSEVQPEASSKKPSVRTN